MVVVMMVMMMMVMMVMFLESYKAASNESCRDVALVIHSHKL